MWLYAHFKHDPTNLLLLLLFFVTSNSINAAVSLVYHSAKTSKMNCTRHSTRRRQHSLHSLTIEPIKKMYFLPNQISPSASSIRDLGTRLVNSVLKGHNVSGDNNRPWRKTHKSLTFIPFKLMIFLVFSVSRASPSSGCVVS